jgi:excisionase family DNA binding protein
MSTLLYTPEATAEVLSVGRSRVYELIATGELRSVTIGRSRRIPAAAIDAYIAALVAGA